jgi:outer membrane murein-binding lipoprotein Lpp
LLYLRGQEQTQHAQRVEALGRETQAMKAELEQVRLQRQETQATEEQLLRRIATLSAQVERLQTDLAFFRQQKKAR